jgi:hypothetical protein
MTVTPKTIQRVLNDETVKNYTYLYFQKRVKGKLKEKCCGSIDKPESHIKAWTLEIQHLRTVLNDAQSRLLIAEETLKQFTESYQTQSDNKGTVAEGGVV